MDTLFKEPPKTYAPPRHRMMPLREQPTYRVAQNANACNLSELLAAIAGGAHQIEIAEALLAQFGDLYRLYQAHVAEIATVRYAPSGKRARRIGQQTAIRLKAAMALGKKLLEPPEAHPAVHSPADAAALVQAEMSALEQEQLRVILLDARNHRMDVVEVYHGSLNSSLVRVGEVFKPAIRRNAAAVVVVHNHPSGDPTPSPEDVAVTRAIVQAGKLVDIEVLDHLVIGRGGRYTSLKERGLGFS